MKFCQSCGMPLDSKMSEKTNKTYCQYCVNENGELKPREVVQAGIADWLKMFTPASSEIDFSKRADNYLKAMPAWAKN